MIRLLQIYNQYRSQFNGEEAVVFRTAELVERHGGEARLLMRSSRDIRGWHGKLAAVAGGIYNWSAARQVRKVLRDYQPDVVHVHNVFPLFSPSVVVACRKEGYPVVMSLHNQVLTCPRADHLRRGKICDRCLGGREYHCVLSNCRENICESLAYAARSAVARRWGLFRDNVTLFIALTQFARGRLIAEGYDAQRIVVLPNMAPVRCEDELANDGDYVGFAGRLSPEKGLDVLVEAAERLPHVPFRIAGGGPLFERFWKRTPPNIEWVGQISASEMPEFYRHARVLVVPSRTYEMCPLVIGEAMGLGIPVIASRLGGLPELVRDGRTGLLFRPGDAADLADKIERLWCDPALSRAMGRAGWNVARQEFGEQAYYRRLLSIYHRAMELVGRRPIDVEEPAEDTLVEVGTS